MLSDNIHKKLLKQERLVRDKNNDRDKWMARRVAYREKFNTIAELKSICNIDAMVDFSGNVSIMNNVFNKIHKCDINPRNICDQYDRQLIYSDLKDRVDMSRAVTGDIIGRGTYGKVSLINDQNVVSKKFLDSDSKFPSASTLRETAALVAMTGMRNIVQVFDILHYSDTHMIYLEKYDGSLQNLIIKYRDKNRKIPEKIVKKIMFAIIDGLHTLHTRRLVHGDIKPHNVLYRIKSNKIDIVITDLGFVQQITDVSKKTINLLSTSPHIGLEWYDPVQTLWWRAPEVLLDAGSGVYTSKIDVWSAGIIMIELLTGKNPVMGTNDDDQLMKIFKAFGTPNYRDDVDHLKWPGVESLRKWKESFPQSIGNLDVYGTLDPITLDLLQKMLTLDPNKRLSTEELIQHPYFNNKKAFIPIIPKSQRHEHPSIDRLEQYDIHCINSNFMKGHVNINERHRMILIDWLCNVSFDMNISINTLNLTIEYIDAFLSVVKDIAIDELQGYGVACILLASLINEKYLINIKKLVEVTNYTIDGIYQMAFEICDALDYDLFRVTAIDYLVVLVNEYFDNFTVLNSITYMILYYMHDTHFRSMTKYDMIFDILSITKDTNTIARPEAIQYVKKLKRKIGEELTTITTFMSPDAYKI